MKQEITYSKAFKSSLHEVDSQVIQLLTLLDEKFVDYNRFVLDLVLRETLNNAVIHGNKHNTELLVRFSIDCIDDQFRIVVEDEGTGFHWPSAMNRDPEEGDDHGRGFPILHAYCNHVELNEKGNQITFLLNIRKS